MNEVAKAKIEEAIAETAEAQETVQELSQQVEQYEEQLSIATVVTQTPIHDLSWWVKWIAAIFGMIGAMMTAADVPIWNVVFGFVSLIGWSYVGILWNDRSIMVMNIFLAGVFSLNLVNQFKDAGFAVP